MFTEKLLGSEKVIILSDPMIQQRGWAVRSVFTEKISGAKKNAERKVLSRMIEYIKAQHIDKVLVDVQQETIRKAD